MRIEPARVDTDVRRLLAAADGDFDGLAKRLPERLEPLLADLDGVDPAFDEWLAGERPRWRDRLLRAIRDAAERALVANRPTAARHLAGFLADEEPYDETVARLAMVCRHAAGDRTAVHRLFERLQQGLRRELGVAPDAETTATYRRLMTEPMPAPPPPVTTTVPARPPEPAETVLAPAAIDASSTGAAATPAQRPRRRLALVTTAAILAGLTGAGAWLVSPRAVAAGRVIAVEPLAVQGSDRGADAVRQGLSDDLARAIASQADAFSVGQVGDQGFDSRSAQLLLSGTASTLAGRLHARLRLRDAAGGDLLWSKDFEGAASRPDDLRGQIVARVGAVLRCALGTRHRGDQPVGDRASRLYLQACDAISDFDLDSAQTLLRNVVVAAPTFARAWADLGVTQALAAQDLSGDDRAAALRQARDADARALALDPGTGLAYYGLAVSIPGVGNWSRRMDVIDRGLAVDPDTSELYMLRGDSLAEVGRSAEAQAAFQRGVDLDPLSAIKISDLISAEAVHGDLDDAEAALAAADHKWPHSPFIWNARFLVELRVGDPRQAAAMLDDPLRPEARAGDQVAKFKLLLRARTDQTPENVEAAEHAVVAPKPQDMVGDALIRAHNLAFLGLIDDAYRLALAGSSPGEESANEFLFRSYMRPFRADPRFMQLARRRGLTAIWLATGRWPDFCSAREVPYDCRAAAMAAMVPPPPRQTVL